MAKEFRILPYPDFLSPALQSYVQEVSIQAGRAIIFCDGRTPNPQEAIASADVPPDVPGVAIIIRNSSLRRSTYNPRIHDAWVAHELTHVLLHAEGWPLPLHTRRVNNETYMKLQAIHNWLTDPLINERTHNMGLSLADNRQLEILDSTDAINGGTWTRNIRKKLMPTIIALRLIVSFQLEPNIPPSIKHELSLATSNQLPNIHRTAIKVLDSITDVVGEIIVG